MLLHGVHHANFLSYDDFTWTPLNPRLNLIVGPNGSGKTNFINALRYARDGLAYDRTALETRAFAHNRMPERDVLVSFDIELTGSWEKELLSAFIAAALCEVSAFPPTTQAWARTFQPRLSAFLRQNFTPENVNLFFRGQLHVVRGADGHWTSKYEARADGTQFQWDIEGVHGAQLSGAIRTQGADQTLSQLWRLGYDEEGASLWSSFMNGQADTAPIPDLARGLTALSGVVRPSVSDNQPLPTHQHFARLAGVTLDGGTSYDLRLVFQRLMSRAFLATSNVRISPTYAYDFQAASSTRSDLSSGENLAGFLIDLKLGSPAELTQYEAVGRRFQKLVGFAFDVGHERRSTNQSTEVSSGLIDIHISNGWGEIPLEYSGAGVAEALYLSAVLEQTDKVVLLDEPASNLHPQAQHRLLRSIDDRPEGQVFLVTHSATLFPSEGPMKATRFFLENGATQRARIDTSRMKPDQITGLEQELRQSANAQVLLFSRAVILVEGKTELGALPRWFEKLFNTTLEDAGISLYSVGGDTFFERYARYLQSFQIPFAVICDGKVIGDTGARCRIAGQLVQADVRGATKIAQSLTFETRRSRLEAFGVYTTAVSARDEFEDMPLIRDHREEAEYDGSSAKPRLGKYLAEKYDCPPEVATLLARVVKFLGNNDLQPLA
jgi:predicted ATPase